MNILYIEHYAGSPEMGMEFRPYYLSREWVRMGHHVSIIAGDYSHLRKKNPVVHSDMQKDTIDGIDYYWLQTGTYEGNGMNRALTMFRFCRKLIRWKKWICENLQPDVIISSSTYPIDAIPAHKMVVRSGARHIHEVHDMWPATLYEIGGMSKKNPFVILMQYGEDYAYRHADTLVSLLPYAKDYMVEHGLNPDKFHSILNGIVLEEWDQQMPLPEEHRKKLEKLREAKAFIVGYFGGHALPNCLMTLLRAAEQNKEQDVHFVLVGDGVEKKQLIEYAGEHNLQNITFLPPIDKRAIPELVNEFDCIYIGAKDSPLYRFGICMNKMFDSMMAGKPIIFAINAPPTPVTEAGCGIVVPPEDPAAINEAVLTLKSMTDAERQEMGLKGKTEILNQYTYQKLAEQFAELF